MNTVKRRRRKRCLPTVLATAVAAKLLFVITSSSLYWGVDGMYAGLNDPRYRHNSIPYDKDAVDLNPIYDPDNDQDAAGKSSSSSYMIIPSRPVSVREAKLSRIANGQSSTNRMSRSAPIEQSDILAARSYYTSTSNHRQEYGATPCYPEKSGYFGATFGTPVQYPFALEIQSITENSATSATASSVIQQDGIETIYKLLQRSLISDVFPKICATSNSNKTDYNPTNYNNGRIIGLKFDNALRLNSFEQCKTIGDESASPDSKCEIYAGNVALYGYNITSETISHIGKGIESSLPSLKSRVATYMITGISLANQFVTDGDGSSGGFDSYTNENSSSSKNNSTYTTRVSSLSVGAKLGFGLAVFAFFAAFSILFMYVRLDLQYRRNKLFPNGQKQQQQRGRKQPSHRYSRGAYQFDDNEGMIIGPVNKTSVLGNKPQSSPETWGPLGLLRSYTGRTEVTTYSTQVGEDAISSGTSTILELSHLDSGNSSSSPPSNIKTNGTSAFVLEFAPGLDPPLGRPEPNFDDDDVRRKRHTDDVGQDEDDEDEEDEDDEFKDIDIEQDLDDGDEDDALTYNSSIADHSNIDEQIREVDRRRRSLSKSCHSSDRRWQRRRRCQGSAHSTKSCR